MKKRIVMIIGIGFLGLGIGFTIFHLTSYSTRKITFEECEHAGGTAWLVDLYHPDICSACAEYQECLKEYNDLSALTWGYGAFDLTVSALTFSNISDLEPTFWMSPAC